MTCLSCRGIGCSACRTAYQLGRITFDPAPAHVCSNCMRGLPCDMPKSWHSDLDWKSSEPSLASNPSLSAAIGAVIARTLAEPDLRSSECF